MRAGYPAPPVAAMRRLGESLRQLGESLRRFGADRDATMAIEFAMVSVPMLGLIAAIFETGLVYVKSEQLQVVTQNASRSILTNNLSDMTYQNFIDSRVCTWQSTGAVAAGTLSKLFDCSKVMVDVSSPTSWSSASTTNSFYTSPNSGSATITMPASGSIAVVRIVYPLSSIASVLTGGVLRGMTLGKMTAGMVSYNGSWTHMLMGVAAFRVE
jgi:Flp pilus assembly protein TadG